MQSKNKNINPLDLEKVLEEPDILEEEYVEKDEDWYQFRDAWVSFLYPSYPKQWERINAADVKKHQEKIEWKDIYQKKKNIILLDNKVLIPETLLDRLLFHTHVAEGHTSIDAELITLSVYSFTVTKKEIRARLKILNNLYLHCDRFPALIRSPLGRLPHATKPNILLHTDYLSIYNGYLLSIVDDYSRKTWLFYKKH
eukprot:snap_masked-scaffold_45-processed-gene-1.14-mRNA-1 protein AED:0.36 eAED:0.43 QI:0/0/0/1/1/1/2/0/197